MIMSYVVIYDYKVFDLSTKTLKEHTQPNQVKHFYFSSIVKQALFAYVNHAQIRSLNQPVLRKESKDSCSRTQQEPLMGLKLTT